jgi:hypothetical protein
MRMPPPSSCSCGRRRAACYSLCLHEGIADSSCPLLVRTEGQLLEDSPFGAESEQDLLVGDFCVLVGCWGCHGGVDRGLRKVEEG